MGRVARAPGGLLAIMSNILTEFCTQEEYEVFRVTIGLHGGPKQRGFLRSRCDDQECGFRPFGCSVQNLQFSQSCALKETKGEEGIDDTSDESQAKDAA
jgi:hypothetical protein